LSKRVEGGIDYEYIKRHYEADDYTGLRVAGVTYLNGIPFTAVQTYYVVGLFAYLADINVIDPLKGWTLFIHGQPAAPAYLLPFLTALGITTWPSELPSFEAKWLEFYATEDCWISFVDSPRVQHFLPANTYREFKRRCFMFFVVRDTADGVLRVEIAG